MSYRSSSDTLVSTSGRLPRTSDLPWRGRGRCGRTESQGPEEIPRFERDIPCSDEKIPCSDEPWNQDVRRWVCRTSWGGNRQNGRKIGEFPVIFPVIRESGCRRKISSAGCSAQPVCGVFGATGEARQGGRNRAS